MFKNKVRVETAQFTNQRWFRPKSPKTQSISHYLLKIEVTKQWLIFSNCSNFFFSKYHKLSHLTLWIWRVLLYQTFVCFISDHNLFQKLRNTKMCVLDMWRGSWKICENWHKYECPRPQYRKGIFLQIMTTDVVVELSVSDLKYSNHWGHVYTQPVLTIWKI